MTPQIRVAAGQLAALLGGSYHAHEDLVHAALQLMALRGVPGVPIVTGPRVAPRADGKGYDLRKNAAQQGFGDIAAPLPPRGRLLIVECKTGRARRSPAQVRMHDRLGRAGALCVVCRRIDTFKVDLDRVLEDEVAAARVVAAARGGAR